MALSNVFKTTVSREDPLNGNVSNQLASPATASDFITVQSLANFAVMAGAVAAAWGGAASLAPVLHGRWFLFMLCAVFGLASVLTTPSPDPAASGADPPVRALATDSGGGFRAASLGSSTSSWSRTNSPNRR